MSSVAMGSDINDELSKVVSSVTFKRENPFIHVLPGIFIASAVLIILYNINTVLDIQSIPATLAPSTVFILAYLISSALSSYYLLYSIKKHLYESSVVTYYFTRGRDFNGALLYIRNAVASSTLPSPSTGILLVLLTGAYPVVLVLARKAVRRHVVEEEKVLLGRNYFRDYSIADIALDLALTVATLGLYASYLSYRVIEEFNNHITRVHGTHSNPPGPLQQEVTEGEGGSLTSRVIGVVLFILGLTWGLAYMGVPYSFVSNLSLGLTWFALNHILRDKSYPFILAVNIALTYILLIAGVATGIAGYPVYSWLFKGVSENMRSIASSTSLYSLIIMVFLNNLSISIPSIIPMGSLALASGVCNAGIIIGLTIYGLPLDTALRTLSILLYPYAITELLAYSILASSVTRLETSRKYLAIVLTGILLLLLAAVLEAITIIQVRGPTTSRSHL
ncbi:hypothetical protein [Desulfurococcus amylolyticus]|uniref:hypothetical protein n=1 Tax=Desulfurococcus amylolyticus TaxID=94694 RepID=UPI0023F2065B|nr:hypothetical protein [Desulfurococcus amylolyticus]